MESGLKQGSGLMERKMKCTNCEWYRKITFGNNESEIEVKYGCEKGVNIYQFNDMFVIDCDIFEYKSETPQPTVSDM